MAESFRLIIGASAANEIPVSLVGPAGERTQGTLDPAQFVGDWSLDEIHKRLNKPDDRSHAEPIGRGLFERLFAGRTALRATWAELIRANGNLPLEIQIEEPTLRGYPWELIWDPTNHRQSRRGGLVRRIDAASKPSTAGANWPFRMLVIIGLDDSTLDEAEQIGARREIALLRRTLVDYGRSIDINVLDRPSQPDLQDTLKAYQPHGVHFIGHGTLDLTTGRNCLQIENAVKGWNWDTVNIPDDFKNARCVPRFVFLNCCRSANDHNANLSLQQIFTEDVGVGAVMAMQADVRGDRAGDFSKVFYSHALAAPGSPDLLNVIESLRKGREALGSDADIDWALPALTLCRDVAVDFKLLARQKWPTEIPFKLCREFDEARVYADESESRRTMIQWLYPPTLVPDPNILIVRGQAKSGKSRLLTWCMETWAAKGFRIRHIDVGNSGGNCARWLVLLRAGQITSSTAVPERFLKTGLDLTPFLPFYEAVARALKLMDGPAAVADPGARVALIDSFRAEVTDDVSIELLCSQFLEGLQSIGDIVIVLDQVSVSAIKPELFATFRDNFLLPIAVAPTHNVRVALSVNRDDYDTFGLSGLDARVVTLRTEYNSEELEELAVEALRYREEKDLREIAQRMLKFSDNVGLGRLDFCQLLLGKRPFRDLERMR